MKFDKGQLAWTGDGLTVTLAAQTDGFLRATIAANAGDVSSAVVIYLAPAAGK